MKNLLLTLLITSLTAMSGGVVWADFVPTDNEEENAANTYVIDADDTGGDVQLQFGAALGEYIRWNDTNSRFDLSDTLRVTGNLEQDGNALTIDADNAGAGADVDIVANQGSDNDGTLRYSASANAWQVSNDGGAFSEVGRGSGTNNNTFILDEDNTGGDVTLQFGTTLNETFTWDNSNSRFNLSDTLRVTGNLEQDGNAMTLDADNAATGADVDIVANQGSDSDGTLRYSASANAWQISNDGGAFSGIGRSDGTQSTTYTLDDDNAGAGANVDIIANQGTDNDGTLRYNASSNTWELSNDGGTFNEIGIALGTDSNTFTLDRDDTGGNVTLTFGTSNNETFIWDNTNSRFTVSDDLRVEGNQATVGQTFVAADHAGADSDGILNLGRNASAWESIIFDATTDDRFEMSDDLDVEGTITADTITLDNSTLTYSGSARPTRQATLSPEFPGATLTGDGTNNAGVITSDFCENGASADIPDTNTGVCNTSGDIHNYYTWDQSGGSVNDYDIWMRWRVPDNFSAWATDPIQVYGKRTDATNNAVTVYIYDTAGTLENAGGTQVAGTNWTQTSVESSFAGTYTPGGYMTIRVVLTGDSGGDTVHVGEISLDYLSDN